MLNNNVTPDAMPWRATACYLYVLHLDEAALAWEYLRRHPDYRRGWQHGQGGSTQARQWGLAEFEDPDLDACRAHPAWLPEASVWLHVRSASTYDGMRCGAMDLWRVRGRKQIQALGHGAYAVMVRDGVNTLRARIDAAVLLGAPAVCSVALGMRAPAHAYWLCASAVYDGLPRSGPVLGTNDGVLSDASGAACAVKARAYRVAHTFRQHLRGLQSLDGQRAGASQRQIAEVLYGREHVHAHWHADSNLRSQVRHTLLRADALMRGGYRVLAGLRHSHAQAHGEKPTP